MNVLQMLFSAKGRIRRRDYWVWGIVTLLVYLVVCFIAGFGLAVAGLITEEDELITNVIGFVVGIPYIWTNVCLVAKRWHDRDKSGWMYLIQLIPLVGPIWQLVECGCLEGTPGRNKYGPSPKGIGDEAKVF